MCWHLKTTFSCFADRNFFKNPRDYSIFLRIHRSLNFIENSPGILQNFTRGTEFHWISPGWLKFSLELGSPWWVTESGNIFSKTDISRNIFSKTDVSRNIFSKTDISRNIFYKSDVSRNIFSKDDVSRNIFSKADVSTIFLA